MAVSVMITGANRGVGLGLVKQFLAQSPAPSLIATYRNVEAAKELVGLKESHPSLNLIQFDVTDFDSLDRVVGEVKEVVGDNGLNLLINNAGVLPEQRKLEEVNPSAMMQAFNVNCVAPLMLTRALMPLLKQAAEKTKGPLSASRACVIQMSTAVASISENTGGGLYAYRCSKAALNMAMKSLSVDLKGQDILVMAMHPGWVKTDMGGANALITTEECVAKMLETIQQLGEKDHGSFLRYNNTGITW